MRRTQVLLWVLFTTVFCGCRGMIGENGGAGGGSNNATGGGSGGTGGGREVVNEDTPACTDLVELGGAPTNRWQLTGPSGGRVTALLATSTEVVLVGTGYSRGLGLISGRGGHIYRSTDRGATLTEVASFPGASVTSLVRGATSARVWAAVSSLSGSAKDGAYVSDDEGVTFVAANAGLHAKARVRTLAISAGSPERIFALVEGTMTNPLSAETVIYVREGANDWKLVPLAGKSAVGGPLTALTTDPTERNRVWVADGTTLYTSTDGAPSFTVQASGQSVFSPAAAANVTKLYADPAVAGRLLLATVDAGLLESLDRGMTWTRRYGSAGADAPAVNRVLAVGGGLFLATRYQGLQTASGAEPFKVTGKCLIDPIVTEVAAAPGDATTIYAGTTGNLYYSRDSGKSFKPASGMDDLLARVVTSGDSLWLMSSVGLYQTKDQGNTWARVAAGVGSIVFSDVAVDPKNPQRILLATDQDLFEGGGVSLGVIDYRLDDKSSHRAMGLSSSVASIAFDPANPSRVFAYQRRSQEEQAVPTGVFRSDDTGNTFNNPGMGGESLVLRSAFRFGPQAIAPDGTLYAGVWTSTGAGLLKSTDGANTSKQVWSANGWVPHSVHVDSSGAVYLAGRLQSVGIRKSTDQGNTFMPHGTGLSGQALAVNQLAFGKTTAIIAATQGGVWLAADGSTFADFNDGLPAESVAWSVAIVPSNPPVAFVTTDRGVYRRLLP